MESICSHKHNIYYLENGKYTANLDELSIEIPEMKNWEISKNTSIDETNINLFIEGKNSMKGFLFHFIKHPGGAGSISCIGGNDGPSKCNNMLPCASPIGSANDTYCYY